jgi:hypothetical protein
MIHELTSTVGGYSSNGAVLTVKVLVDSFSNLFGLLSPKGNCDEELRLATLDDQNVTRLIGRFR